jgi:hypothetical protein
MALDDEKAAEAIAAEWGVDVDLLNEVQWEIDALHGNDDELHGYIIRFDEESDPEILAQLGVAEGELSRRLSINAFDEPDYTDDNYDRDLRIKENVADFQPNEPEDDDGIFSMDEPLPDLSPGDAYLTDHTGRYIADDQGRLLVATGQPFSGTVGDAPVNEYEVNGPTYAGRSFAGHSFATTGTVPLDRNAIYQRELESRIERLEAILKTYSDHLPPRNHNHPPELVEPDPIAPSDLNLVVKAVVELKIDLREARPDPVQLEEKASLFRRVAGAIVAWCLRKADAAVDSTIQWGVPIGLGWLAAKSQEVQSALNSVAEAASAWANYLTTLI